MFWNSSLFAIISGFGEVKLSDRAVSNFIQYIKCDYKDNNGKKLKNCKPALWILSKNGNWNWATICGHNECWQNEKKLISRCESESGDKCGVFAKRRTIYWDNGINTKKNKARFSSKMSVSAIKEELASLGFTGTKKIKTETKKKKSEDKDIIAKLKDLKKLLDDEILTKEEFAKEKKKLLN